MGMYYFHNRKIEWQLTQYVWTGCTDIDQRDAVMAHSVELSTKIIKKLRLVLDDSVLADLKSISWAQIEKTLYKYRAQPYCRACFREDCNHSKPLVRLGEFEYRVHTPEEVLETVRECPKCGAVLGAGPLVEATVDEYGGTRSILYKGVGKLFNMWCQVTRTVCFAHLKKSGRDLAFRDAHVRRSGLAKERTQAGGQAEEVLDNMREFFKYDWKALLIIDDLNPNLHIGRGRYSGTGIVDKTDLARRLGLPRAEVVRYLRLFRALRFEFEPTRIPSENWTRRGANVKHE